MHRNIDEQELARRCSLNDRQAAEELYTRYAARLFTLCRRYTDNREDAKDIMQETFVKALEQMSSFNYTGNGSLYAWMSRIAVNEILNHIKKYKLRFVSIDIFFTSKIPEPTEEEDIEKISEEDLLNMISKLTEAERTIFNMHCMEGFSHHEIGQRLGISERGSASLLTRAKAQLRVMINEHLKNLELK